MIGDLNSSPIAVAKVKCPLIAQFSLCLYKYFRMPLFLWRKHEIMSPCTGSRVITELLHVLELSSDCGPQSFKATPPPSIMPSVITTRTWPARQKRSGTSRMVSHSRHNNEPTLSRNDSALGCLHLALAYRYYFCMEETWDHVSVHWKQGNYQLGANCFMCWNPVAIAGLKVSR